MRLLCKYQASAMRASCERYAGAAVRCMAVCHCTWVVFCAWWDTVYEVVPVAAGLLACLLHFFARAHGERARLPVVHVAFPLWMMASEQGLIDNEDSNPHLETLGAGLSHFFWILCCAGSVSEPSCTNLTYFEADCAIVSMDEPQCLLKTFVNEIAKTSESFGSLRALDFT